jgi:hypothetical protein
MSPEESTGAVLEDPKVNIRILLAAFWLCHFALWTFGDMLSLLQQENDPIKDNVILIVAPTTAVVQVLMVVFCLIGPAKYVRMANLIVTPVYLLFNIGYLAEASEGWHYYLGIFYILFNVLILWHAWNWPTQEDPAAEA